MNKKIVIAGGTGFVGKYLQLKYESLGYDVFIISRGNHNINWDDIPAIINSLEQAEMLINLAGKSVDCRYTQKNKTEIYNSRIYTTKALGNAILQCKNPPALWLNSSTATIYRHAEDKPMTETTGEIGAGFSVGIATAWEKAFFDFKLPNTRQVALRMAIVLGKNGGVIQPLKNLVRFGLGGKQGKGNQMFSWIHIEDVFNSIQFINQQQHIIGTINLASPTPVSNSIFMKSLRAAMQVSIGIPTPSWLLKIGAFFIRTETELILKSRWVIPQLLLSNNFKFTFNKIDETLKQIIEP